MNQRYNPLTPAKLLGNWQISNQTKAELILNMLAEASTKDILIATNPKNIQESKKLNK